MVALVLVSLLATPGDAQVAARRASILLAFSGETAPGPGSPFGGILERTIREAVGKNVGFQYIHLGLTTRSGEAFEQSILPVVSDAFRGYRFDAVVVQRPEALAFLLRHRGALFPGVPLVFTDVFADELEAIPLSAGVTGVSTVRRLGTLPVAFSLVPGASRVAILAGSTAADRRGAEYVHDALRTNWPSVAVDRLDGMPLGDQLAHVAQMPERSFVLFASYGADAEGHAVQAPEVLHDLAAAARAPTFGFDESLLGSGLVGGDLLSHEVLAARCAQIVKRILDGGNASAIHRIDEPASVLAFDAQVLARWGIAESRLPAGSTVRFRPHTLWNDYQPYVIGGWALFIAQALLIGGLVFERRRRRRAQAALADAELRYRTVADFAVDWEYWTAADGTVRHMSPSCRGVTGFDAAEFVARPELLDEIVVDDDRAAWRAHRSPDGAVSAPDCLEFRIRRRDGQTRWIEHHCSPVRGADGADLGRRVSNRDVTARKQAEAELRGALREIEALRERLEVDNSYLREQAEPYDGLEGIHAESEAMRYVASRIQQVAPTSSSVLLLGETGVGKSLLAQAIHQLSPRRSRPLVTLNCATLPPALIESELFGHERGAFTGAQALRRGRFEVADGGTLFLDEVAELPLALQAKLLRAVQDGEFERVGSSVTRRTDVRMIAATNRKLDDEVRAGRFRQDLLYRLNVFPITVPPLRQRPEDIPILVGHFLEKHCRRLGVPVPQVSKASMKALQARAWPGNVRELENVLERALISSRGARFEIESAELAEGDDTGRAEGAHPAADRALIDVERAHIVATLDRLRWRVEGAGGAAEVLGLNASTLRSRMRKLGIRRPGTGTAPGGMAGSG